MRAGRLILGVFAITLLCGRYGNADDDVSLDHEDDVEEFDMEGLLDVLIKTRGRSAAPRAPAATAHPSYSALEALLGELDNPELQQSHREAPSQLRGAAAAPADPGTVILSRQPLAGHASITHIWDVTGCHFGHEGGVATSEKRGRSAKYRKDSVDGDSLRTREKYQRQQAERLRKAFKDGKPQERLVSSSEAVQGGAGRWSVPCALEFYQDAYGVVEGCTPSVARGGACSRVVIDDFASAKESRDLLEVTEVAMKNLFHQGGTTSLAPASSLDRLGARGENLFQMLMSKVKLQLMDDFGLDVIYDSGALLTRLEGEPRHDEWDVDPRHIYWNPHVDKANIPTYDYSALLYLNTHGSDFEGGEFAFLDDDADRIVSPRAGRLLYFTSGPENLHQVREVTRGTRYVLAMWFTCSKADRYSNED